MLGKEEFKVAAHFFVNFIDYPVYTEWILHKPQSTHTMYVCHLLFIVTEIAWGENGTLYLIHKSVLGHISPKIFSKLKFNGNSIILLFKF